MNPSEIAEKRSFLRVLMSVLCVFAWYCDAGVTGLLIAYEHWALAAIAGFLGLMGVAVFLWKEGI